MIPRQYKAYLLAAAFLGATGAGWVAQGWRMGKRIETQRADYAERKARRGQDYADTLARAAQAAAGRITEADAMVSRARAIKAKALNEAAQKAPRGPEYGCRDLALPEDYLEGFRQ